MTAWLDNDRLSAYLDGELSPQERQIVEKLLASDPAARQLVEELRAQRELIQRLPRLPIPRDLSRSVVALAEHRRAGREGLGQAEGLAMAASAEPSQRSLAKFLKRLVRPRNLGWALIAASIGIAIALISPQLERRGDQVEVARRDNAEKEVAAEKQRFPGVAEFRAAPSGRSREMAESASQDSMGRPAEPGPAEAAPETAGGAAIASGPAQADRRQVPAEEAPQVVIERMVPMMGHQLAAPRMGTTSPVDSQVASYEIICDVTEKVSLQTLVGRVIRKHQAIPEEAALDAAWEFAANREDRREQQATGGGGDQEGARPDVRVAFRESEEFEEAVIEFSATLAQVQGVLAELGAQPGQIRNITIPQELAGVLEESRYPVSDRIAAKGGPEGLATARSRVLPSIPKAATPAPPSAAAVPTEAKPADQGRAVLGEVQPQEPGVGTSARRNVTPAASSSRDLYRIRVVLRHKRASETGPSAGAAPQAQGLGGTAPQSPTP